jgi:hypothetical protein
VRFRAVHHSLRRLKLVQTKTRNHRPVHFHDYFWYIGASRGLLVAAWAHLLQIFCMMKSKRTLGCARRQHPLLEVLRLSATNYLFHASIALVCQ